jgi:transcriptional regulator with XRE-family HTH domain
MTDVSENDTNWYREDAATLGDRLVIARETAGLSQVDLAAQLGVKVTTLDAWENDHREPRANRLQMLTGLLGVSLGWLLTGVGEGPDGDDDVTPIPTDIAALLADLRTLRTTIVQSSIRLGQLEKRLRKAIKDS